MKVLVQNNNHKSYKIQKYETAQLDIRLNGVFYLIEWRRRLQQEQASGSILS